MQSLAPGIRPDAIQKHIRVIAFDRPIPPVLNLPESFLFSSLDMLGLTLPQRFGDVFDCRTPTPAGYFLGPILPIV